MPAGDRRCRARTAMTTRISSADLPNRRRSIVNLRDGCSVVTALQTDAVERHSTYETACVKRCSDGWLAVKRCALCPSGSLR